MLAVPLLIGGERVDPEIRGQIDHAAARVAQPRDCSRRRRVRQRREREFDAPCERRGVDGVEAQVEAPAQRRKHVAHLAPRALFGGHCGDLELGMPQQNAEELEARVPAGPDDRHLHREAYRLENWKRARAPLWPYFLRSFLRASRVRKPRFLSAGRFAESSISSARVMPWRSASAWPEIPPPCSVAAMS